jgi:putative ABC transport system permease protein
MILPKLAVRSLVRNRKNSVVLVGLITAGIFLFVTGYAVLSSATGGMKREFQDGYTGNIAIRVKSERKFGLFGISVPNIGEYEDSPILGQVPEIRKLLAAEPGVISAAALVSGAALLQGPSGYEVKVPIFGVKAEEYFRLFPAIHFISGSPPLANEAWIVLPKSRADDIEKAEGRKLCLGDSFQFTMASGSAFTIRAVKLAGIVETPIKGNDATAPVYTDPVTLRSLMGITVGVGPEHSKDRGNAPETLDVDSFFGSPQVPASPSAAEDARGLDLVSQYLSEARPEAPRPDPELGAWHFILVRLKPGMDSFSTRWVLNESLKKAGISAEAVGWLSVAGLNASILSLIMSIFKAGMAILAAVVTLVLANGLAFSVLEQTGEIGTMRAMGAQGAFIKRLYFLESIILVGLGTLIGLALAMLALQFIGMVGIPIKNSYLFQLFGTALLKPAFPQGAILISLCGGGLVAVISSIYPIHLATRMSIVETMAAE